MKLNTKKTVMLAFAGVMAMSALGCVKSIRACQCTVPGGAFTPAPGTATVILMHPGKTLGSVNVLDARGTPITVLDRGESWAISAAPGRTRFFANMGGGAFGKDVNMNDLVELDLAEGRTYYVTATANPVALRVLTPGGRENRWQQRREWVSSTKAVQVDANKPGVGTYFGDTQQIITTAEKRFARYDDAHLAEHLARSTDSD